MIEADDRIMVCMSGGKDSFGMLHMLRLIQRKSPFFILNRGRQP